MRPAEAEAPRTAPDWSGRNFGGAAERTPVPIKPAEQPRARTVGQVSSSTTPRPGRLTTEKNLTIFTNLA
jgi:hypothetical protein